MYEGAVSASAAAAGRIHGDGELLARMRDGDASAFALVMRSHNRRLYRLARGILRDEAEAEDAVQEGYVRAFTHLDGFKGEASLATWLARIVVNEALYRLRRQRPSIAIDDANALPALASALADRETSGSPEHMAARREIRLAVECAVDALPAPFRTVFVLRIIEQLSVRETADCLSIPEETVKTRLYRANRLLRQSLSAQFASIFEETFPFAGGRCDRLVARVLARIAPA